MLSLQPANCTLLQSFTLAGSILTNPRNPTRSICTNRRVPTTRLVSGVLVTYLYGGFGRVENRSRRRPGEESPNTTGRDAA